MHYAKQGLGSQSRRAEMRCQHCTGALMYECGEIKRVTRQTGGGWKGESNVPRESSCTSASRCYHASLPFSITLPFLYFFVVFHLFIYLFPPCISSSLRLCCCCFQFGATEEATALTRNSGHKDGATEIRERRRGNTATQKILAYP